MLASPTATEHQWLVGKFLSVRNGLRPQELFMATLRLDTNLHTIGLRCLAFRC